MAAVSEYRDNSRTLRGIGFLDILPSGLSSVYFAFDPEQGKRSLGSYSIYAESEVSQKMGKAYYYLGFWVPGAKTMDYKADFPPFQLAFPCDPPKQEDGVYSAWKEFKSKDEALGQLSASAHR